MYVLKHGIKKNPEKFWALPDRIFFGYGACPILAGVFLSYPPLDGFYGERIIPSGNHYGNHIYVTNGVIAFDYHGYSSRERLLEHHKRGWVRTAPTGTARWKRSISICSTLPNLIGERCGDRINICKIPYPARRFLQRIDHAAAATRALKIATR
ncbi:hypothetical protein [Mesorhizobium sp. B261B1A]|uniref:hypothetical protein n=1 Tax=unclassified Mesorhizobium TaxID=325217 RepID=UPI00398C2F0B